MVDAASDRHEALRRARVAPAGWRNPAPAARYDLLVLGGGTAGLVSAAIAAGLGARTALVERAELGGDCLNVGCVPSKALLAVGRAAAAARDAARFGVVTGEVEVDFGAAMERMRRLRAEIAAHDSAERFRDLGVDVFFGDGGFIGSDRLQVEGATLAFRRAVLATGSRAVVPQTPGLAEAAPLTNETVFDLGRLPARLAVIGGGATGCELAQAFARLGARVALLESGPRLLPRDDPDAAAVVAAALSRDGVEVRTDTRVERVELPPADRQIPPVDPRLPPAAARLALAGGDTVEADRILVATGRAPNVEAMGLEAAGIETGPDGVRVDARLQTTNPRVWAAGDVVGPLRFTHLSDAHARLAVRNALFPGSAKATDLVVPWVTYTDPEVAQVGHTAESAAAADVEVDTHTVELREVDRAILDGTTGGFVRLHARKGKGAIVGATIVAPHAGETIGEMTLAMTAGIGLAKLSDTIHPYPTVAEALRRIGDTHRRKSLTPRARWLIEKWLAWRR